VSGSASVTLQPGIYYLQGGGLTVSGSAFVAGKGVMIYITGMANGATTVNISGSANVTLSPPTSGTYQGIVLFQDRTLSGTIAISGHGSFNSTGTVYAPRAKVVLSGSDTADNPSHTSLGSQWIVADLTLSGNASFSVMADANNRNENPNGYMVADGPLNSPVPVAPLTQAEVEAALQEALTLWGSAGLDPATLLALGQVTVIITPLPAPYLGMAAPNIIYLDPTAEGYGWFTDVSPTAQPAAGQIDLLTVMAHELGHLFGLMDGNGTALLASTLAPGVRILPDAADLLAPHTTLTVPLATAADNERYQQDLSANTAALASYQESASSSSLPLVDTLGDGDLLPLLVELSTATTDLTYGASVVDGSIRSQVADVELLPAAFLVGSPTNAPVFAAPGGSGSVPSPTESEGSPAAPSEQLDDTVLVGPHQELLRIVGRQNRLFGEFHSARSTDDHQEGAPVDAFERNQSLWASLADAGEDTFGKVAFAETAEVFALTPPPTEIADLDQLFSRPDVLSLLGATAIAQGAWLSNSSGPANLPASSVATPLRRNGKERK
jgi:hypothetical protein